MESKEQRWQHLESPEICDVEVGAEPCVVGQVPTLMIGIFVDRDLVAVPEPVIAEAKVEGADSKVEAAEPEAFPGSSSKPEDMAATEAAGETPVFPGMIEVIAGIIAA